MGEESELGATEGAGEVVVAVDRSGSVALVVIADVSADGAWVSVPESEAPDLEAWR